MKIAYLLNHPNDVPAALILYRTCPIDVKLQVILINFRANDKYNWFNRVGKGKWLEPCIQEHDLNDIKKLYDSNDVIDCRSEGQFDNLIKAYDISISRGREYIVLREKTKKSIALSMNRCHFNRLVKILPEYKNMQIFLYGPAWLKQDLCGNFQMEYVNYDDVNNNLEKFQTIDIMGYYYEYLKEIDKDEIKKELGIPLDRKIAFLSFRMAEEDFTAYRDLDEFMEKTTKMIHEFKDRGYYILCRERKDKANSLDISRKYKEVEHLIDKKIDGHDGFPPLIYRAMYISDILLLSDVSGICTNEAVMCRTPVYMPYEKYFLDKLEATKQSKN